MKLIVTTIVSLSLLIAGQLEAQAQRAVQERSAHKVSNRLGKKVMHTHATRAGTEDPEPTDTAAAIEAGSGAHVDQPQDQLIPVGKLAVITVCSLSGDITVRGWARPMVHAVVAGDARVKLLSTTNAASGSRVEVVVSDDRETPAGSSRCNSGANLRIDVPRDATVEIRTLDSTVDIEGIAKVSLQSQSGDLSLRAISQAIDASSAGGDISVTDSTGRVNLHSINGTVDVRDAKPADVADPVVVSSIGGDVSLTRISHRHVSARTIAGELVFTGPLTSGGDYALSTTQGDITLALPPNPSLRINAHVAGSGAVVTDFAIVREPGARPLTTGGSALGTIGSGDATVTLISISGTIRLRKKL